MTKLHVGQKVYTIGGFYNPKTPIECTVTKIGKKYFELSEHTRKRFHIENLIDDSDTNYKVSVYLSLKEIEEEQEYIQLSRELRQAFSGYGKMTYSLDVLRQIKTLING